MPEEQEFITSLLSEFNTKLRDMEEKQRLSKERLLLLGKNLVETRQSSEKNISSMKSDVEEIKRDIERIKSTLVRIVEDLDERARKSDLEILKKQASMFRPLENLAIKKPLASETKNKIHIKPEVQNGTD